MSKPKLLIVDDHDGFRESLVESHILNEKFKILEAYNGETALDVVNNNSDLSCILLDYDFHGRYGENNITGLDVMQRLSKTSPHIPIIMMSGITAERGRVAIESIKQHAIAFLDKPFTVKALVDKLDSIIKTDLSANLGLEAQKKLAAHGFASVSAIMAKVCKDALDSSDNDMNLTIIGETGTGKTYLAKIIHNLSKSSSKNFIEYNCGNVSGNIDTFNSQIFGHVKGAFTGAIDNKKGVLEAAGDGTVFFDDITSMPLEVQKGLLQAMEEKKYRRLGDEKNIISFNARVIASTNRNINEAVNEKLLREDLKFRLCGEIINIPPLRNRTEDIPSIIKEFFSSQKSNELKEKKISEDVFPLLMRQPWLGNVRQLLNVVYRASFHEKKDEISLDTIKNELWKEYGIENEVEAHDRFPELEGDLETTLIAIRKKFIIKTLKKTFGNVSSAAYELGYKNHRGLQYWIDKLEIDVKNI